MRILIVRLGALGDILHALPAVTAIRQALPSATIGWVVEEKWSELLTAPGQKEQPDALSPQKPVANLIHTVNTMRWRKNLLKSSTFGEIRGNFRRLHSIHYDVALDFQGNAKSAVFGRLSHAARFAGFVDPREAIARLFYTQRLPRSGEHVIEQNHAMAVLALRDVLSSGNIQLTPPELPRDPQSESWADAEIRRLGVASFVIVTPGAGWGGKQWPTERFGQVAAGLAKHNFRTLVNCGPGEDALARAVIDASGGAAMQIRCTISQLIAITRRCKLFIGGDTGPLHIAASLQVPVVGIYGPTDPARTGPFGTRAITLRHPDSATTFSHHTKPDDGMLKITADDVLGAARHLLGGAHA
ncbi:MAG TPA: glycosyltransferase family 9 protein [Candidatus Angelobacter sp.]|jgi:heptosyltransferase-1|nr:glycosyltransferase family 9 protein [Candidatus Angelobacter sp.]